MEKVIGASADIELKDARVLDIGCGSGMISAYYCKQGARVYGVDISEEMIGQARIFLDSLGCRAELNTGNAARLSYDDGYFDVITCISVIEWIDADRDVIKEIGRLLKPGGIVLVSVPNRSSWMRKAEMLWFRIKRVASFFLPVKPGYLEFQKHQYRPLEFVEMCRESGLHVVNEEYYAAPFSRFAFIKKAARKNWFGMIYFVKLQKNGASFASSHSELQKR